MRWQTIENKQINAKPKCDQMFGTCNIQHETKLIFVFDRYVCTKYAVKQNFKDILIMQQLLDYAKQHNDCVPNASKM